MSVTENAQAPLPDFVREHDIDHVTLDIIENTLSNTRYEMDRVLETTAVSPVIREQSDQFPLIADRHARMVMGQFGCAISTIIEHSPYEVEDLRDGDVIALNDPYLCEGSVSHTPDFMILRPIFYEGDLVGYTSQWGNLIDVGGTAAGSMPISARSIYHEGIRMPPIKLYDQGRLNEEALRMFCHNTRVPAHVEADIKAIAAGTAAGAARVIELCERFGKDTYLEACDAILDRTRSAVIELIRQHLPDGERFSFEDLADDDGLGTGPIKLRMTMWRDGDTLNVDWDGCDPQVPGSVNFYLNPEMFKMFCGVFLIMAFAPDVAFNDGYSDIINVTIPEGSVLRPNFPAPLGNRLTLMARHFDVVGAVFSKALSQFSVSGSYGTSPNFVYSGVDSQGEPYQILEILYGGIPARPVGDGLDGHSWWPLFKAVPTEYLEKYYPLRVDAYRTRQDSGGAGYHRGGHGVDKIYTFLEHGQISFQDDRAHTFPWGVSGGRYGASSSKRLIRQDGTEQELPSKVENLPVSRGDKLVFSTAGAGGLGSPLTREPERVAKDVRAGLVSADAAREHYGVVLGSDGAVDAAATESRRSELGGGGEQTGQFDFGPLPDPADLRSQIAQERRDFDAEMAARGESEVELPLRIAIVGTGATGSVYAGLLASAGHDVTAVDAWRDHMDAIRERGLRVTGASGDRTATLSATTDAGEVGTVDLVVLATKAHDVESAATAALPLLGEDTIVLPIQNGLGSRERVATIVGPERVMTGVVGGFGASIVEPGHVHHHGMEMVRFGERSGPVTDRVELVADAWREAGFTVRTFDDVDRLVWEKLICNVAFSATCAITGATIGGVIDDPDAWPVAQACATEAYTVAVGLGVGLGFDDPVAWVHEFGKAIPGARPSMLLDVLAGRTSEVDVINGSIPPLADELGIPAPVNRTVTALVHAIERTGTAPLPQAA